MIRGAEYPVKTQILLKKKVTPRTGDSDLELGFWTDVTGMEAPEDPSQKKTNLITQSGRVLGESRGGALPLFQPTS